MNRNDRKQIRNIYEVLSVSLEDIKNQLSTLEEMRDEEESKFDNMPEGLQESERGEAIQEAIDKLSEVVDMLESVASDLEDACNELYDLGEN